MRKNLADIQTPNFPFQAVMRGEVFDYKRMDMPVTVIRRSGMERHYYFVAARHDLHIHGHSLQLIGERVMRPPCFMFSGCARYALQSARCPSWLRWS